MVSIRERILQRVLAVLTPVATSAAASLHRSPTLALQREDSPALVLIPEAEAIVERANDRVTRELTVKLVALAQAVPPDCAEQVADALLTAAHVSLFTDLTLGGLALGLRETDIEFDVEEADGVAVALPVRYVITYRTLVADWAICG